jgi:hypothetical protein
MPPNAQQMTKLGPETNLTIHFPLSYIGSVSPQLPPPPLYSQTCTCQQKKKKKKKIVSKSAQAILLVFGIMTSPGFQFLEVHGRTLPVLGIVRPSIFNNRGFRTPRG